MLRFIGAGCLVAAAGLLGERAAQTEQRTLATIDALLVSFAVLEAEIAYLATDLEESFQKAAAAAPLAAGLYKQVILRMRNGERVGDAWRKAVCVWSAGHRISTRQKSVLAGLSGAWGPWRAEDHIRHIKLAHQLLQAEQEASRAKLDSTCRMWRYFGVGGGLLLALLLY